jgi:hypothetical protein
MVCGRHGTYWPEAPGRPAKRVRRRLCGENGLLLTPSIDHLLDRGFIGFEGNGNVIISPVAHRPSLEWMGTEVRDTLNVGPLTAAERQFLEYHRDLVLLKAAG